MTLRPVALSYDYVQTATPSNPSDGETWLDTNFSPPKTKVYDGAAFVQVQTDSRVESNLDAAVSTRSSHTWDPDGVIPSSGTLATTADTGGVDPSVVRNESSIAGWHISQAYSQPANTETVNTGASINFDQSGMQVVASSADGTGQYAFLNFGPDPGTGPQSAGRFKATWVGSVVDGGQDTVLGFSPSTASFGSSQEAFLDYNAGNLTVTDSVGTDTASITVPPDNTVYSVTLEIDHNAGETIYSARGAVSETATVSRAPGTIGPFAAGVEGDNNTQAEVRTLSVTVVWLE